MKKRAYASRVMVPFTAENTVMMIMLTMLLTTTGHDAMIQDYIYRVLYRYIATYMRFTTVRTYLTRFAISKSPMHDDWVMV
jgi:hypothetical protein